MNDKCCLKCDKHPETGNMFSECPVKTADPWSIYTDYCSRYSPLPDKTHWMPLPSPPEGVQS